MPRTTRMTRTTTWASQVELLNTPEGLSEAERDRLERFGPNKFARRDEHLVEAVSGVRAADADDDLDGHRHRVAEAYLHDSMDGWIDVAVLVVLRRSALVGFWRSPRRLRAALRESLKPSTVRRENKTYNIDATALVPGDVVCLGAGGAIPRTASCARGDHPVGQAALPRVPV